MGCSSCQQNNHIVPTTSVDSLCECACGCAEPVCATPQPCTEITDAKCIVYTNPDILSAGDVVVTTNTSVSTALNQIVNYFSSMLTGPIVPVTYSELRTLILASALDTDKNYLITDYQTVYDQPDYSAVGVAKTTVATLTGPVEPLIVTAVSTSKISNVALSTVYPNDHILYDQSFTTTEVMGIAAKGRITQRTDSSNNTACYDIRNVVFKRYLDLIQNEYTDYWDNGQVSLSNVPTFLSTAFNIKMGNIESDTYSSPFLLPNTVFLNDAWNVTTGNAFCNNTMISMMESTFGDECFDNTFYNGQNLNNTVSSYVRNNKINGQFRGNIISDSFNNNVVGQFSDNTITGGFNNNIFQQQFRGNLCYGAVYNNTFSNDVLYNNIGQAFYNNEGTAFNNNVIEILFYDNTLNGAFINNNTGGIFNGNVIGIDFTENNILAQFTDNIIGDNFGNNAIGIYFYNNNIGDNFESNTVGENCTDNTILRDFKYNTLGYNVSYNEFGYGVQYNQFGNEFLNNIIANEALFNSVGDYCWSNDFSGTFDKNIIGSTCQNNIANVAFEQNIIATGFNTNTLNSFFRNQISAGFVNNTTASNFSDNIIQGDATSNNIGSDFIENVVGTNFINNTISADCFRNRMAVNFRNNEIATKFSNNDLGASFYYNTIGGGFSQNTTGEGFRDNVIGNTFEKNNIGVNFFTNTVGDDVTDLFIQNNYVGVTIPSNTNTQTDIEGLATGFVKNTNGVLQSIAFGASTDYVRGDGSIAPFPSVSGAVINEAKAIYIDATYGNDTTGTKYDLSKPFLTWAGAITGAVAGDWIIFNAGTYSGGIMTPVTDVNVFCKPGVFITGGFSIATSTTWKFLGSAVFNGTVNPLRVEGTAQTYDIQFDFDKIDCITSYGIILVDSSSPSLKLLVNCNSITASAALRFNSGANYNVTVNARQKVSSYGGRTILIGGFTTTPITGLIIINSPIIESTSDLSNRLVIQYAGEFTNANIVVNAPIIRSTSSVFVDSGISNLGCVIWYDSGDNIFINGDIIGNAVPCIINRSGGATPVYGNITFKGNLSSDREIVQQYTKALNGNGWHNIIIRDGYVVSKGIGSSNSMFNRANIWISVHGGIPGNIQLINCIVHNKNFNASTAAAIMRDDLGGIAKINNFQMYNSLAYIDGGIGYLVATVQAAKQTSLHNVRSNVDKMVTVTDTFSPTGLIVDTNLIIPISKL